MKEVKGKRDRSENVVTVEKSAKVEGVVTSNRTWSVFWVHSSCCCCEYEDMGKFKVASARIAVERALKGKLKIAKDDTPCKFRTATGIMRELVYFYGGEDLEDTPETIVVLEGVVTANEAEDIVTSDFQKTDIARQAAKKAWKTMKDREAKMSPEELNAVHLRRSQAAKKAWKTIRGEK